MKLHMALKNTTKTCYRFEYREADKLITLYLKKADVEDAGINPVKGIVVNVEEDTTND